MATDPTAQAPDRTAGNGGRPRWTLVASVVLNLLLGVFALVPLYSAQWLLTEYLPMDCRPGDLAARPTNFEPSPG